MNALEREKLKDKVRGWLKDEPVCLLTTKEPDGTLRSRPMVLRASAFDGELWFLTTIDGPIARAVRDHPMVSISVLNADKTTFVAVSGYARLIRDASLAMQIWSTAYEPFFPLGLRDPDLVLLRVNAETAEYWDSPCDRGPLAENRQLTF